MQMSHYPIQGAIQLLVMILEGPVGSDVSDYIS